MKRQSATTTIIPAAIFLTYVAGCTNPSSNGTSDSPRLTSRLAEKSNSRSGSKDSAILGGTATRNQNVAVVSGKPIRTSDFLETLIEARGLPLLQQMIFLEAVRAESNRREVDASKVDIDREYDLTLREAKDGDGASLTPDRRKILIDKWCSRRGISREELHIAITRQALLRKMAGKDVVVSGKMLEEEFDRTYGEKAEVRHLQVPARRTYAQIKRRLARGEDFVNLVHEYSVNSLSKASGGLLPPFTKDDTTVPRRFAEVAFSLEPGTVSPLFEAEGSYHVIKLERMIPPQTAALSKSRRKLERDLRDKQIAKRMEELGRKILDDAEIRIDDKRLRRRYLEQKRKGRIEGPALSR